MIKLSAFARLGHRGRPFASPAFIGDVKSSRRFEAAAAAFKSDSSVVSPAAVDESERTTTFFASTSVPAFLNTLRAASERWSTFSVWSKNARRFAAAAASEASFLGPQPVVAV